jgi:four helix bundle protein
MMVKSFSDLEVWKRAHRVVLDVYRLTNPFPRSEQFGVVSQLRRAAYSIPSNIAEGFGRRSTKELLQFLAVANGSLEELRYFLLLSRDLRYLSPVDHDKLQADLKSVAEMLEALAKSLRRRMEAPVSESTASSSRGTDHGSRVTKQSLGVTH